MSEAVKVAEQLAEEFRCTAAEYDRTGEFPSANYARMKETGYLRAPVPVQLGGLGAGLADMARAQQALARGCGSTALAVNMHLFQVGTTVDAWRNKMPVEPLLKRIVDEGIVIASNGAESIVAGDWTTATTAEKRNGEYIVNGRKFFCSQAPGMDILRFFARDTETGELLVVGAGANALGLKVVETWDTTGMRATASHDIVIDDLHVPETAIGARLPAGAPTRTPAIANIGRWFLMLASSVYLGIAEEARAEAYKAIGGGINSANRDEVLTNMLIGQMEAEFLTARSIRDQAAMELDTPPSDPQAGLALAILCKETVTSHAIATVEKAVEIAGGRAYFRKSPLERLARDVRAARFHPPASPVSFQMAGERMRDEYGTLMPAGRR
ncbi:MAG TPA: acyl-CoA dehydrogenase family protein [Dehalococcoidia bacterium]|nr:acyl-CoA dehydrogenase family protein [Dehalococcoidia bacterium]